METPKVLRNGYERELDRLLKVIEAGGDWPPAGSEANALLRRAMRPSKSDRKDWVIERVRHCRPDKLARSRSDRASRIEAHVASIEAGGEWPGKGSAEAVALASYITPGHRLFRQDIYDRIGNIPRPKPSRRASAAEIEATIETIVSQVERTGILPRATESEGRMLRSWIRPSDTRFRPQVWQRLADSHPTVLDYAALAAERAHIAAAVAAVVAGTPWPARQSVMGARLARAIDPGGFFYSRELVAQLEMAAPQDLARMRQMRGRGGSVAKKKGDS